MTPPTDAGAQPAPQEAKSSLAQETPTRPIDPTALAGMLREVAARQKRSEDRSEKLISRLSEGMQALGARLDDAAERSAPGGDRIEALAARLEDINDTVAALSGDIEGLRKRFGASNGGDLVDNFAKITERLDAAEQRDKQKTAGMEAAMKDLATRAARADETSAKVGRALAALTARLDAAETQRGAAMSDEPVRLVSDTPQQSPRPVGAAARARHAAVDAPPPSRPAASDDDKVAPYIAQAERELAGKSGGSDIFDRIAAAAEKRFDSDVRGKAAAAKRAHVARAEARRKPEVGLRHAPQEAPEAPAHQPAAHQPAAQARPAAAAFMRDEAPRPQMRAPDPQPAQPQPKPKPQAKTKADASNAEVALVNSKSRAIADAEEQQALSLSGLRQRLAESQAEAAPESERKSFNLLSLIGLGKKKKNAAEEQSRDRKQDTAAVEAFEETFTDTGLDDFEDDADHEKAWAAAQNNVAGEKAFVDEINEALDAHDDDDPLEADAEPKKKRGGFLRKGGKSSGRAAAYAEDEMDDDLDPEDWDDVVRAERGGSRKSLIVLGVAGLAAAAAALFLWPLVKPLIGG